MPPRKKTADIGETAPAPVQKIRPPMELPGFKQARTCGNCDHFDGGGVSKFGGPASPEGVCHNGISGRIKTTIAHGCGHGFYPCTVRWPLRAGPGGVFGEKDD